MNLSYFCYDKDIDTEYKWRIKSDQMTNKQNEILCGLMNHGKLILHNSSLGPPIIGSFFCDDNLFLFQVKRTSKNDIAGRPIYLLEGFYSSVIILFSTIMPYLIAKHFDVNNTYAVSHEKLINCSVDISIDELIKEDTKSRYNNDHSNERAQMTTFSNYHLEKYKDLFAIEYSKDGSTIIGSKAIQSSSASIAAKLEWCVYEWISKKQSLFSIFRIPEGRLEVIDQNNTTLFRSSKDCYNEEDHSSYQDALMEVRSYLTKNNWQPTPLCDELFFKVINH